MDKRPLKKKSTDPKVKNEDAPKEKIYSEINIRSFDYNFNVLIHHYKKKELSLPARPK